MEYLGEYHGRERVIVPWGRRGGATLQSLVTIMDQRTRAVGARPEDALLLLVHYEHLRNLDTCEKGTWVSINYKGNSLGTC